jgi:hypothetical protein
MKPWKTLKLGLMKTPLIILKTNVDVNYLIISLKHNKMIYNLNYGKNIIPDI